MQDEPPTSQRAPSLVQDEGREGEGRGGEGRENTEWGRREEQWWIRLLGYITDNEITRLLICSQKEIK